MNSKSSFPNLFISQRPLCFQPWWTWIFFLLFVLSNTLLAFGPFSLAAKLWIGLMGLGVPLAFACWVNGKEAFRDEAAAPKEIFSSFPSWIWALLALAAILLRFYRLTTLSVWPLTDEALSGYFSLQLAEKNEWSFLYGFTQLPPLYTWGQGLFFKVFGVSLRTLWLFPALLSLLTVGFAFLAARAFFPKSIALIFGFFMVSGFWPLYVGRFSDQGVLLLLWVYLALWRLGVFLKSGSAERKRESFWMGLCVGAGFYTFPAWLPVAFAVLLAAAFPGPGKKSPWGIAFAILLSAAALTVLPLGFTALSRGYGDHLKEAFRLHWGGPWIPQVLAGLNDLCAFFWGSPLPPHLFAYRPFWGGLLNPVMGSFFFLGLIGCWKCRSSRWARLAFFSLVLFYLPGFVTGGLEMFRVLPLQLPIYGLAAVGFAGLLRDSPSSTRGFLAAGLLVFSSALDYHHLYGAYGSLWRPPVDLTWFGSKSVERARAYGLLKKEADEKGPGCVLSELVTDQYDQSLSLACYSFNAAQNPRLDPQQAHWTALLINVHYLPYLSQRFPGCRWTWLAPDVGRPDGGLMLGVIPLNPDQDPALKRWLQADDALHSLVALVLDNRDQRPREPVLKKLFELYPLMKGDRFLQAWFWEKVAENRYGDRDYEGQVDALRRALAEGYPAAHLYNDLGALWLRRSHWKDSRAAFLKAVQSPFNHTSAAAGLEVLEEIEKSGTFPRED